MSYHERRGGKHASTWYKQWRGGYISPRIFRAGFGFVSVGCRGIVTPKRNLQASSLSGEVLIFVNVESRWGATPKKSLQTSSLSGEILIFVNVGSRWGATPKKSLQANPLSGEVLVS